MKMILLLLGVLFFWGISDADAATCTAGVDCYCDLIANVSHPLYDPNRIACEDFDHPAYYDPAHANNWVARVDDGHPWNRGNNSLWFQRYFNGSLGLWKHNEPTSPLIGQTCNVPGFSECVGQVERCSLQQGNLGASNYGRGCWNEDDSGSEVVLDIFADLTDLRDEVPGLTLTGGNSAGGVTFGNYSFAYRHGPSDVNGILGTKYFGNPFAPTRYAHVSVTHAMAYSSNTPAYGLHAPHSDAWKHEEWFGSDTGFHWEMSMTAGQQNMVAARPESFPFTNFMFNSNPSGGGNLAACEAALAAVTLRRGVLDCDSLGNLLIRAEAAHYTQSIDFPFGSWGCFRHEFIWSGGFFSRKSYFNDTLVIDFEHYNVNALNNNAGYQGFKWNDYMNINSSALSGPEDDTTVTLYRYVDNYHVRQGGAPVTCAQIGFGAAAPSTPSKFNLNLNLRRANYVEADAPYVYFP